VGSMRAARVVAQGLCDVVVAVESEDAYRHGDRRCDDRGHDVVGAVPERAVGVPIAVVARRQPLQGLLEVVIETRTGLDDRHPGRRVRDENVAQSVAVRNA
jgi:hypothetical protein